MKSIIEDDLMTEARSYNYRYCNYIWSVLFRYNSTRIRTVCLLYLYV